MLVDRPPAQVADRFWMLGAAAYPLYLYVGEKSATLFEGGIGAMGPVVREQLAATPAAGLPISQIVVTHAHPDHVMAVPFLREAFPGAAVLASEKAAATMAAEKAIGFFVKIDATLTGSLVAQGLLAPELCGTPPAENRIAVDRILAEGDVVEVDAVEVDASVGFRVLQTPGHSDCSLSFFEPSRKILVLSDATGFYMPREKYLWPNYFSDYAQYVASIERVALLGAEAVCLSHNGAIVGGQDVADYFAMVLDATREYHRRIVAEAQAGKSMRDIAAALGAEIHGRAPVLPLDFFEKNCSLLVKQSLRHAGIAPA
jgi:glyoxylase-like metal-dependent hydrolase (beta-lactamase superfamily II)